jgi:2-methylisocitrate lyase-like PEP mutase family enzyme
MKTPGERLRELIARPMPTLLPLAMDPLSARTAEAAGFEALYLGGGALGYVKACTEANLTLTQMTQAGQEIRAVCNLPLVLDGAGGYGDPMHIYHTICSAESAGFAAIELEDQLLPKRVHHHIGIEHCIPLDLMVHKIRVAVSARQDPNFVIIGRTNACRSDSLDEALRRGEAYRRAGADMLLVLPKTADQARTIAERLGGPLFYMMLGGVASIGMSLGELGQLGYRLVGDSITPFYARHRAFRLSLEALAHHLPDPTLNQEMAREAAHVHEVIGLERWLEIERRSVES